MKSFATSLFLVVLFHSLSCRADEKVNAPCLSSKPLQTIISIARQGDGRAQDVSGIIHSWDPTSGAVTFYSNLSKSTEKIFAERIEFRLQQIQNSAQTADRRIRIPVGRAKHIFKRNELAINDDGAINFPGCVKTSISESMLFAGSITFGADSVTVSGDVSVEKMQVHNPTPSIIDDHALPKGG